MSAAQPLPTNSSRTSANSLVGPDVAAVAVGVRPRAPNRPNPRTPPRTSSPTSASAKTISNAPTGARSGAGASGFSAAGGATDAIGDSTVRNAGRDGDGARQ